MKKMKNKIILASSSPRRKELFDKYGIDYTVDFVETEEVLDESLTLFKRLENIALQKAKPLQIKYPNNIIVSADTMVTFQDEMLGKPKNREDAKRMLELLSNNKQVVITAVCIIKDQQSQHLQMQQLLHLKKYLIKKLKIILIQMNGKAKRVLMQSKELLQSL